MGADSMEPGSTGPHLPPPRTSLDSDCPLPIASPSSFQWMASTSFCRYGAGSPRSGMRLPRSRAEGGDARNGGGADDLQLGDIRGGHAKIARGATHGVQHQDTIDQPALRVAPG